MLNGQAHLMGLVANLAVAFLASQDSMLMTPYQNRLTPLVKRMAEDMLVRNFSPSTINTYTYQVDRFQKHFNKPIDELGEEEIHRYQVYLVTVKKASWSAFNQAVCGLRFLYEVTLRKPWTVKHIPFGKRPKTLPTVLGDEEVQRLLSCVNFEKHRLVLLVCYAAGLRLSEATCFTKIIHNRLRCLPTDSARASS